MANKFPHLLPPTPPLLGYHSDLFLLLSPCSHPLAREEWPPDNFLASPQAHSLPQRGPRVGYACVWSSLPLRQLWAFPLSSFGSFSDAHLPPSYGGGGLCPSPYLKLYCRYVLQVPPQLPTLFFFQTLITI